jgi:hypothetical protein
MPETQENVFKMIVVGDGCGPRYGGAGESYLDIPLEVEPRKRLNYLQKGWLQTKNDLSTN